VKRIAILGSTGSIGVQTLDVIAAFPDRYAAHSLTVNTQIDLLEEQICRFAPRIVAVSDPDSAKTLEDRAKTRKFNGGAQHDRYGGSPSVHAGVDGLIEAVTHPDVDIVISALPGSAGVIPTLQAIEAGTTIGLANKEILVMAGEVVMAAARRHEVDILPVDSEHCAVHQCLGTQPPDQINRIILTASGGPFRNWNPGDLNAITAAEALDHPTWNMGRKVTIDSATLMNKGFEVIEAHWLFNLPVSKIDVLIHPQSIIHSMVEMVDGSVLAQLGPPDMRAPIQYVLSYPDRLESPWPRFDITQSWSLTLDPPDHEAFPCLPLAYKASDRGGMLPAVLSPADEVAVDAFLNQRIGFNDIPRMIADAMEEYDATHQQNDAVDLNSILAADRWTRTFCDKR